MGVTTPPSMAQEAQPQQGLTADSQGNSLAQGELWASAAENAGVMRRAVQNPVDYAGNQPTRRHAAVIRFYGKVRLLRLGRHATRIFLFPQEKQSDLGRRAATPTSHGNKDRDSGVGIIRHGPIRRCLGTTQQLDVRIPG